MITTAKDNIDRENNAPPPLIADPVQQYYQSLWQGVQQQAQAHALTLRLLGITSSCRGEGVSTIAMHLALTAAKESDCRVLLVDADFAHPSMQHKFGVTLKPGLAEVLCEYGACEANIHETAQANLFVLTAGVMNGKPSGAYDAIALGKAIKEIASDFDLIIFDMPPVGETSFTMRLSGLLDGLLLVVDFECISMDIARRTVELLNKAQAIVLGTILNKWQGPASIPPQKEF